MPLQKVTITLSQNGWHFFIKLPLIRLKSHVYGHLMGLSQQRIDLTLNRHLAPMFRQLYNNGCCLKGIVKNLVGTEVRDLKFLG